MSRIYISYAPEDADVAATVAAQLVQSGREVINVLTECDAITLVFSAAAVESQSVREEVAYALWKRIPITWIEATPASLVNFLFLLESDEHSVPVDAQLPSGAPPANSARPPLAEGDITDMFFAAAALIGDDPGKAVYLLQHLGRIAPDFADGQIGRFARRIINDHREGWLEALVRHGNNAIRDHDWSRAECMIADIRSLDLMGIWTQKLENRLQQAQHEFRQAQLVQLQSLAKAATDEDQREEEKRFAQMMLAIDEGNAHAQEILAAISQRNESDALYKLASLAHSQGREKAVLQLVHQVNKISPDYGDPNELISNQVIGVSTGTLIKVIATLEGHEYAVNALAFTPDGTLMASGSSDNTIRLWEMPKGRQVAVLRRDDGAVRSIVFSPDGAYMASLSGSVICVRTMPEGHEAVVFDASKRFDNVASLAFSPNSDGLICGHVDGQMSWVNIADGRQIMSARPHNRSVQSIVLSSTGKHLVSCAGNTAKTWQVLENTLKLDLIFEEARLVNAVCLSPDETMLVNIVSSEAATWSLTNGELLFTCKHGPNTLLSAVAFAGDNSMLASGATDGKIKLWTVPNGSLLNTLEGERNINALEFSPDGSLLAAATDRDINLWGLPQKPTYCS